MQIAEVGIWLVIVYIALLLLLELAIWKLQPSMDSGVTLLIGSEDTVTSRKVYGFEHEGGLYVSSNHWFRSWYHAVLKNPIIDVECSGKIKPYKAILLEGDDRERIANAYQMSLIFRLLCGFAPRRFLKLEPLEA